MTYTIKPLEWEEKDCKDNEKYYETHQFGGIYSIFPRDGDGYILYHIEHDTSLHKTLEAAKQAAQSHWEERLKEALEEVI